MELYIKSLIGRIKFRKGINLSKFNPKLSYTFRLSITGFLFTLPVLIFFTVFNVIPMVNAISLSFTNYDLVSRKEFVGLDNYLRLSSDPNFVQALNVTSKYALYYIPALILIAFILASLLRTHFLGRDFFRWIIFGPSVLSLVGMSIIWKIILNREGPINLILNMDISWLSDKQYALLGIVMMEVWRTSGFFMLIFLVGLQAIPKDYYDAAKVDGANAWQLLKNVTFPLMRPTFALVTIILIINSFKVFTPMFIMTEGGPANSTRSIVLLVYRTGMRYLKMGQASAMSVVIFVIIFGLSILQLRYFRVGKQDR